MKRMVYVVMMALMVGVAAYGMAQELEAVAPISPEHLESWFFNFLERLLGLIADFIGQILSDIFGGIAGLFAGSNETASAIHT